MSKSFISEGFKNKILKTKDAVMNLKPVVPLDVREYLKKRYKEVCDLNKDLDTAHRIASRIKNISKHKYTTSKNKKIDKLVAAIKDFRTREKFFRGTFDESDPIAKMSKKIEAIVNDRNDNHSNRNITDECDYSNIKYAESKELKSYMAKMISCKNLFKSARLDCNYVEYMAIFQNNILGKLEGKGNTFDLIIKALELLHEKTVADDIIKGLANEVIELEGKTLENLERMRQIKKLYYWVDGKISNDPELYKMFLKSKKPERYDNVPKSIDEHNEKIMKVYDTLHNGNFINNNNEHRGEITAARNIRIKFMKQVLNSVRVINSGADLAVLMNSFENLEVAFASLNESTDSIRRSVNEIQSESGKTKKENVLSKEILAVDSNRKVSIAKVRGELLSFNTKMMNLNKDIVKYDTSIKQAEGAVKEKHSKKTKAKCIFKIIGGILGITGQLLEILSALKIL